MKHQQISIFELLPSPKKEKPWQEEQLEKHIMDWLLKKEKIRDGLARAFGARELEEMLKAIHGIGGHSLKGGFIDYGAGGVELMQYGREDGDLGKYTLKGQKKYRYTWKQVAKKTVELMEGER